MDNLFTEKVSDEKGFLKDSAKVKRKRGRPPLTEEKKAEIKAKRDLAKTKPFAVGQEPNHRKNN